MKKTIGFFLVIVLSNLPAAAGEETATFQSAVPDYTSMEIMGIPANWVERSDALVSIAVISREPELLSNQQGVIPVQKGTNREDDRSLFAIKSAEYAVIQPQFTIVERAADSRIDALLSRK